ncbi:MAG: HD domain-containing protein [Deltaproteobacteria bacterium]|nr:MAG: HD domain-containing protein [Deltaproteobacteria bacterium]
MRGYTGIAVDRRIATLFESPNAPDLASRTAALIDADPAAVLAIATHIGATGAAPPHAVTRACRARVGETARLDGVALREAIEPALMGRDVDRALQWLYDIGFTALHLPELDATKDLAQEGGRRHKDVWEHTKLVVKQSVRRPAVRWAALLHDIGKVPTRTFTRNGVHFHGHAEVGARMFDKIARRIVFDKPTRKKIRFLIKHHLRSNQYSAQWTDSAVRRFAREMDEHLVDLLDLSRADITSKRPGRRQALLRQISELSARIDRIRAEDAKVPPLQKGIGTALMAHFGLPPSRRIGDLKRALEAAIERGELEARREDAYYLAWLERSGLVDDVIGARAGAARGADGAHD